jgi:peptidoglycan/LPS O-acetylase OafA/YrhL
MGQVQNVDRVRQYVPALEGIRGYGFLLVFLGHYLLPSQIAGPDTPQFKFLTILSSLGLFGVPVFFVLSGYLIGGILYGTRDRDGYFKVFYTRRILRVFPVYYITLLAIAAFYMLRHISINYHFWIHFLYIENLLPGFVSEPTGPALMGHFWSLAVEEQFYLLWPLAVWFFPKKDKLLGVAISLVVFCCIARIVLPFVLNDPRMILFFTPARADAILLGVVLALVRNDGIYYKFERIAKWVVLAGVAGAMLLVCGEGIPWGHGIVGREILIPLVNFTAVAVVVAVMEENSWMNRVCSQRWACWVGSLSYSLYVFHYIYAPYFFNSVIPRLSRHMPSPLAAIVSCALALSVTLVLSILSYQLIEGPVMKLKGHMKYGAKRVTAPQQLPTGVLAKQGT